MKHGHSLLSTAAILVCLGVAIAAALLGLRRLDDGWNWLAVTSVAGLALFSIGLIRLILSLVDNWIERAAQRRADHACKDEA